jgi:hypothetical protein
MCIACVQNPIDLIDDAILVNRFLKKKSEEEMKKFEALKIKETLETVEEFGGPTCAIGKEVLQTLKARQYELSKHL